MRLYFRALNGMVFCLGTFEPVRFADLKVFVRAFPDSWVTA